MKHLAEIVKAFSQKRILVIGDTIADQFVHGQISRVSREAPVFILSHEHTETTPGGAGNCAANLAALGAKVALVSVIGDDEPGKILLDKLNAAGIDCNGIVVTPGRRTTTKVRVLAGQIHSTRQQVIRIDYDSESQLGSDLRAQVRTAMTKQIASADALIISDYGYGVAEPDNCEALKTVAAERKKFVIVDSRFRLSSYSGFTSATPNEDEVAQLMHEEPADLSALESACEVLRGQLGYQALLVTRGSQGMMLIEAGAAPLHIDAVGSHQSVDVTGAGDTVIATYASALACGVSFADAAQLANLAGGIVVMKRGTATVSAAELLSAISQATNE